MKIQNTTLSFSSKDAETGEPTVDGQVTYYNVNEGVLLFIESEFIKMFQSMNSAVPPAK
jgi:hypothetical protein